MMNEQQYVEILWRFVGWSSAAVVALVSIIYGSLVHGQRKLSARQDAIDDRVDGCATKPEVQKIEKDLKDELREHRNERMRRDDKVDETLGEIKAAVTDTHRRMDDLYRAMVNQSGGGR